MLSFRGIVAAAVAFAGISSTLAFNVNCNNNLAVYWGQNSYGAVNANDPANWQKTLSYYCQDDTIDVIPIAFLTTASGTGGYPVINLANTCNAHDNGTFSGTGLAKCQNLASDIATCQAKGKILLLSLGGANGQVSFSSSSAATAFADQLWSLFFEGSSSIRPFGNAVLDGVDLDIETAAGIGFTDFINQMRSHFSTGKKPYYISGAPQCVYPDASLGSTLNSAWFDMVFVQFYNNPCGTQSFGTNNWNYGIWDQWAKKNAVNKNVKIFIGAPASSTAAGTGYVSISQLQTIADQTRTDFSSFGGIMMWDASQAWANNMYATATKTFLKNGGSCDKAFVPPACTAPAYVNGQAYPTAGTKVSYNGYIWQNAWWTNAVPGTNSDWTPVSQCSGSGSTPTTTTTTSTTTSSTTTTTSTKPTTTTSSTSTSTTTTTASPTSTPGQCTAANQGSYVCVSSGTSPNYQVCNNGAWVSGTCASGTVCKISGSSIVCDYP